MRTQSIDTAPEFERLQIARIRSFSPFRKFASVRSWTHTITSANLHAMHSGITEPNERDIAVRFVRREYGKALAADFQAAVEQRPEWSIREHDLQVAMIPVIEALERLDLRYYLSGSIACSIYGLPRGAQDIDIVVDIQAEHVSLLVKHLRGAYIVNEQSCYNAIAQRNAFSLLHLSSLVKVDLILPHDTSFDSLVSQRAQQLSLIEEYQPIWIASPEDVVLMRLEWYRDGEATADDQWNDILGVLKVQAPTLDLNYLCHVAQILNVSDLLEQALVDAGLQTP
jgi:hypothetical protein